MAFVHETVRIEADPRRVWDVVGNPARIAEWVPSLASSTTQGDERRCAIEGGGVLVERIVERSDVDRFYEYETVYASLPLRSHRSRLAVHAHEDHAHVDWTAEFEAQQAGREEQLAETFAATYRSALDELRARLEADEAA